MFAIGAWDDSRDAGVSVDRGADCMAAQCLAILTTAERRCVCAGGGGWAFACVAEAAGPRAVIRVFGDVGALPLCDLGLQLGIGSIVVASSCTCLSGQWKWIFDLRRAVALF